MIIIIIICSCKVLSNKTQQTLPLSLLLVKVPEKSTVNEETRASLVQSREVGVDVYADETNVMGPLRRSRESPWWSQ